jgi:hypothetical protein
VFVYGQRRKERMREYNDKKTQRNFGWWNICSFLLWYMFKIYLYTLNTGYKLYLNHTAKKLLKHK